MKHCPECNRNYADPTLSFCLQDGAPLIFGQAVEEPQTAILGEDATSRIQEALPTSPLDAGSARTIGLKKSLMFGALGALLLVGLAGGYWRYSLQNDAGVRSIAVLPFANESGSADFEYISDGLPETLIYRLSQIPDLQVSPRSSVFRYKGKQTDPAAAAGELGADAVVSGSVAQRGENLVINVDLIDARTGKLIWGDQFDRRSSDLLATQREIAREIVAKLKLKVSSQEKALTKHYTESNEAYRHYIKGRFFWNRRTAENLKKAIEEFQQAADADPNFALASVGLADCYVVMEQYAGVPSSDTLPKARVAALRALQIDDSLAEAHTSSAMVYYQSWQLGDAEKEYKRAIELNRNYATAHHWYSILLTAVGRADEAMSEIKLAQQADPLSPIIAVNIANQYIRLGDHEEAESLYVNALELDSNFPRTLTDLGFIYLKQGRSTEGIAYLQKAAEVSAKANEELSFMGYGYAFLGMRREATEVLKELETRYSKRESPAMYAAAVYAALGDTNQAFVWLEKDFQQHDALLPYITILPIFDTLRDDPRYTDLLKRMGFR